MNESIFENDLFSPSVLNGTGHQDNDKETNKSVYTGSTYTDNISVKDNQNSITTNASTQNFYDHGNCDYNFTSLRPTSIFIMHDRYIHNLHFD